MSRKERHEASCYGKCPLSEEKKRGNQPFARSKVEVKKNKLEPTVSSAKFLKISLVLNLTLMAVAEIEIDQGFLLNG